MRPSNDEYLGVDAGAARVGIARGSSRARLAEPLATLPASGAIERLASIASNRQAAAIVVGLPRNLDGNETAQTETVRRWAQEAKKVIKRPFYWQDEALTSQKAAKMVNVKRPAPNGPDEHAVAAAIILQNFLDTPAMDRVKA